MHVATALGIDVGGTRKGYDLVLLDDTRTVLQTQRHVALDALRGHIDAWRPDVVCIDSPPAWAVDAPRKTEAYILALGLSLYRTPWTEETKANAFYAWMLSGFEAFAAARNAGYAHVQRQRLGAGPDAGGLPPRHRLGAARRASVRRPAQAPVATRGPVGRRRRRSVA